MDILLLFVHSVPDDRKQKVLDRLLGAIPQIIKALSFGEFRFASVKDREYTFRPFLLVGKPGFVLEAPLVSFRDAEILFLEKWRRDQLRASGLGLSQLDSPGGIVCAELWGSDDVGERCRGQCFSGSFGLLIVGLVHQQLMRILMAVSRVGALHIHSLLITLDIGLVVAVDIDRGNAC